MRYLQKISHYFPQPDYFVTNGRLTSRKSSNHFTNGKLSISSQYLPETCPILPQTSKMEHFEITVNGCQPLVVVAKLSILDVCGSPGKASAASLSPTYISPIFCDNHNKLKGNIKMVNSINQFYKFLFRQTMKKIMF